MEKTKKLLGAKIQLIRKHKNLTQENLAEIIGIEVPSLSNIETGKFAPSIETMKKISTALNTPISEFYKFQEVNAKEMLKELEEKLPENKKILKIIYHIFKSLEYENIK